MKSIKVVAGLIWQSGRLLVCQRHRESAFPLKWEFPGGKVEPGETETDALKRELREELDIELIDMEKHCNYPHVYNDRCKVELWFYRVLRYEKQVRNLVFENIRWVTPEELAHLDFLDGDLPLVRRIIKESRENR